MLDDNHDKQKISIKSVSSDTNHIGGINEQLGGVDPEIDNDLMRLAGGP